MNSATEITAADPAARRRFALYWALIRPGSGLIRRDVLATVARLAQGRSPSLTRTKGF